MFSRKIKLSLANAFYIWGITLFSSFSLFTILQVFTEFWKCIFIAIWLSTVNGGLAFFSSYGTHVKAEMQEFEYGKKNKKGTFSMVFFRNRSAFWRRAFYAVHAIHKEARIC